MDTASSSHDAEGAFAALLHRLASPLGAIANYTHLLPAGSAPEVREGILAAMASARATLRDAQQWLDALETTRGDAPAGGVDIAVVLQEAGVPTTALPRLAAPDAAAQRLVEALTKAAGEDGVLRAERASAGGIHLVITQSDRAWTAAEAARAFALFPPRDSGSNEPQSELAIAGSLASRLGGRAWGAVGPAGEAELHLELPAAKEEQDA